MGDETDDLLRQSFVDGSYSAKRDQVCRNSRAARLDWNQSWTPVARPATASKLDPKRCLSPACERFKLK